MSKLLLPNTRIFSLATEKVPLQRKQDSASWQIFLEVSLCMFDDFTCHSWESHQNPGHASRKFVREKHELYLSCILIGQQENKSSCITEIVLPLGFADAIFRRERSDDRKCVCASQARVGSMPRLTVSDCVWSNAIIALNIPVILCVHALQKCRDCFLI